MFILCFRYPGADSPDKCDSLACQKGCSLFLVLIVPLLLDVEWLSHHFLIQKEGRSHSPFLNEALLLSIEKIQEVSGRTVT